MTAWAILAAHPSDLLGGWCGYCPRTVALWWPVHSESGPKSPVVAATHRRNKTACFTYFSWIYRKGRNTGIDPPGAVPIIAPNLFGVPSP